MLIITILSYQWDDNDQAKPGIATLMEITGWSKSSMLRHMGILEDKGVVQVIRTPGRNNTYDFSPLFQKLQKLQVEPGGTDGETTRGSTSETRRTRTQEESEGETFLQRMAKARQAVQAGEERANQAQTTRKARSRPPSRSTGRAQTRTERARERFQAKSPDQYNANDMFFVLEEAWLAKWQNSVPGRFAQKDRANAKLLIDSYGAATVAQVIRKAVDRWEEVKREFNIRGHPSMGIFTGFRNSIFPYIQEQAPPTSRANSKPAMASEYRAPEKPRKKKGGWGRSNR